jgi:hypothetical protein
MKFFVGIFFLLFLCIFFGCNRADQNNYRIYAEGKIIGNGINPDQLLVKIFSNNTKIAETIPETSGSFVLSGPRISSECSLSINKKIMSFSASKQGCKLSPDSMQIIIPSGITYIVFNEINLE